MSTATARIQPPRETPATIRDIITVQMSLASLLEEETLLMEAMQLPQVGALQERKLKLTSMLERYMRYMQQHPEVATNVTAQEKEELKVAAAELQRVMKKNYDTLLVARAVNKTVVKCVTQLVVRKQQNPIYTSRGATRPDYRPVPVSITLNETV